MFNSSIKTIKKIKIKNSLKNVLFYITTRKTLENNVKMFKSLVLVIDRDIGIKNN